MKGIVKKGIIYSMIGIMQLGIGASVIEASPKHEAKHKQSHEDNRDHRIQEERNRHAREMQRRENEAEREYKERQEKEKAHHEEVMRTIGGLALLYILTK